MTTTPAPAAVPVERPRGILTTTCAVLLAAVLARPGWIPTAPGHLGSLTDTMLPWTALALPALFAAALLRRSRTALAAVVLPLALWLTAFGGTLTDKSAPGGDLTVVSHNVNQDNPDPQDTVRRLLAAHPDILALEELSPETAPAYERALAPVYRHHFRQGTVGVWSVYPLSDATSLPIMPWSRALRATAGTPHGPLTVYVAHLPSVRVRPTAGFTTAARDEALRRLTTRIRAENAPRSLLLGRPQRLRRRPRPAPAHLPLRLGADDGGRGVRVHVAVRLPGGPHRPDPRRRRTRHVGLDPSGHPQRPPAGGGDDRLLTCGDG
ncbi:endonuclease/exonuclease/phosphatase family protein [Streptomyces griseoincarnatus]